MPRIPRQILLIDKHIVHKTIHSHHNEFTFEDPNDKRQYLKFLFRVLPRSNSLLHAFSLMDNHIHELFSINNQKQFSNFMRDHLSLYGQYFNKKYSRKGHLTNDRPGTTIVQNDNHLMFAVFYIHANPIEIVGTDNLEKYEFSTHNLYAYGIRNEFTQQITFPQWYVELGDNDEKRQENYRIMFQDYLSQYKERIAK